MRFNFRKVSAIASSALMLGMTMGLAAAANYPSPFVVGGSADVAVVYGTGAGVSTLDAVQAGSIQTNLQTFVSGGGTTVTGGDSYQFEKTSTKFHLGDNITQVISSSLDDDELPGLLAEGKFVDDDNDEFDYTQTITIGPNLQLSMFEDNDYAEDEPTIGFRIPSGITVLNYTLDFNDEPLMTDLTTTDLPIMGKTYYVLTVASSSGNTIFTLLDSADSVFLSEGETITVGGRSVSISFIASGEVRLTVDGATTNSLAESETQKLADGSYVGIKDILFNSKEGTLSSVEFSIGAGKLELTGGSEIQINDDTVPGITAFITNTTKLSKLVLQWDADDDVFVTETGSILMPGFEVVRLSFGGLDYPVEEVVEVEQGGDLYAVLDNFPLKDGPADINFLYATTSGAFAGIGKDANNRLITSNATSGTQNITFDKDTDDYFILSWSDGNDAESYLMRATNFILDGTDNETDFQYYKDGVWTATKSGAKNGGTFSIGNAEVAVGYIDRTAHTVSLWENNVNTGLNGTLYSATGLKVNLPREVNNLTLDNSSGAIDFSGDLAGHDETDFDLVFVEEDKDDNKASGDSITLSIGWDGSATAEVEVSNFTTTNADATKTEIGDTDVWRDFTYSALATELLSNEPSSGQKSLKLIYHDTEVAAAVYITSPEAVVSATPGGPLGDILVTDSEVGSVSSKNLIVIGGSCINSVAANLVGGALCGSAWTDSTGVGSGQFLIQSFGDAYTTGKIALLVAGYEAADTTNAGTFLRTQTVDTAAGMKYLGTSSTSATLQVS